MPGSLAGRHALVGGGSCGLGKACALAFARQGARVTIVARDGMELERTRAALVTASGTGDPPAHGVLAADYDDLAATRTAIARWLDEHGPVHVLVNNSGGPPGGAITGAATEEFERGFTRHVLVAQAVVQLVLPGMKAAGWGRIVNIVSTSVKEPIPGLGVSNTVRGAVASWAKTLASELAPHGITVNNILPGAHHTERLTTLVAAFARERGVDEETVADELRAKIPMGRFGDPDELGAVAAFLASPAASYVTGVSLPVDGGRTGCL
jgi:3-oxoacyl-[acyl-carrier protein] reductase